MPMLEAILTIALLALIAGIGLAWGLLPSLAALATPYGAMLFAKVTGFVLLIAMAARNRNRLMPKIRSGNEAAAHSFRQIAAVISIA